MIEKEASQISVVIGHPGGNIQVSLEEWIRIGPGPRPLVRPIKAILDETGEELSLSVIPLKYRNNSWSRLLIRLGILSNPWS